MKIIVDEIERKVNEDFTIRFVEEQPVLYFKGKRIVKSWKIEISYENPKDPFDENANTADI